MNCANCNEEVYFDIKLIGWRHVGKQMTLLCNNRETFAEPKTDEPKKDVFNNCGKEIELTENEPYVWQHKIGPYIYCNTVDPKIQNELGFCSHTRGIDVRSISQ